jgi:squalene-hopene/tetraprenyl-beta-curcumene cyclase
MKSRSSAFLAAAVSLYALTGIVLATAPGAAADRDAWDAKAAAAYLDGRAAWWMAWPNAARDRGTFCVSCHTAVPYALARPALRAILGERDRTALEQKLLDNVSTRVTLWNEVAPFYPDQTRGIPKTSESRGTEAVLNALLLANRDAEQGRLSDTTRAAFRNLWALQMKTGELSGAWAWLDFHYEPWESRGAPYFGASLAAVALRLAPEGYAAGPDLQDHMKLLRDFFQREFEHQSLFNRLMALWGSGSPGSSNALPLLTKEQRQAIVDATIAAQQPDGGWSLASLGAWKRLDGTALDARSDGYATGLATLALQAAGVPVRDAALQKGLEWLARNQVRTTGQWAASSLNKERDPATDIGRFMSDAATAYAALSLTAAR